ncbi:MAG TPA: universal stress protein [Gemmatimonadaceae bacterium]|nr:universal stress protein [Gemmatimonadaceae bacterium]
MIRKILVPLDQSELAERAIVQAVELAKSAGATIRLLNVWTPMPSGASEFVPMPVAGTDDRVRVERLRYLDRMADWIRDGTGLPVETAMATGFVAECITEDANAATVDVIVMSTHGRTGWSRMWIGSVADAVVRHSDRPVFLVRPVSVDGRVPGATRARTVLVPLDGTPASEQVLESLADVIDPTAHLLLLHVVSPAATPLHVSSIGVPLTVPDEAATVELVRTRRVYLEAVAARLREEWPRATIATRVEVAEVPARVIIAAAADCDLVALATHGRGPSRLLLGSVTDKVLRGTPARLLVRRMQEVEEIPSWERMPAEGWVDALTE